MIEPQKQRGGAVPTRGNDIYKNSEDGGVMDHPRTERRSQKAESKCRVVSDKTGEVGRSQVIQIINMWGKGG